MTKTLGPKFFVLYATEDGGEYKVFGPTSRYPYNELDKGETPTGEKCVYISALFCIEEQYYLQKRDLR